MADMATTDSRPLSVRERAVLDLLLSVRYPGVDELRLQAATAVVVGRCGCGCPTFDVGVDSTIPVTPLRHRLAPVELRVLPVSGEPEGEIILSVDQGRLSSVEYVYYSNDPPTEWPDDTRLAVHDRSS
jgi:hypothetical protein